MAFLSYRLQHKNDVSLTEKRLLSIPDLCDMNTGIAVDSSFLGELEPFNPSHAEMFSIMSNYKIGISKACKTSLNSKSRVSLLKRSTSLYLTSFR